MKKPSRLEKIKKARESFKKRLNKEPSDDLVETIEEVSKMYEEEVEKQKELEIEKDIAAKPKKRPPEAGL